MTFTTPVRRIWARLTRCDIPVSSGGGENSLYWKYDREADLLVARFGVPVEADTVVVEPDVTVRISRTSHQPVGIEVVDCAAKFHKSPSAITVVFARELLAKYGLLAMQRLQDARRPTPSVA